MDNELDDILNNFKNYSETPPELLKESIMGWIESDALLTEQMSALQSYEIHPSPQLFNTISTLANTTITKRLFSIKMFARVAAAFVLLLVATWYIMQSQYTNEATQLNDQSDNPDLATSNYKDSLTNLGKVAEVQQASPATYYIDHYAAKLKPVGQNEFEVVDNDLLYTLMYCNYYVIQPYLPAKKNPLILNVDQYSSVAVNEKMIRFMNVLYKKNKRQGSTWKSRRAKNTLLRWKKKESKYFDASADHSPMDIISITEFIKNNR